MLSFDLNFFPRDDAGDDTPNDFQNLLDSWLASLLRNGNIATMWQVIEMSDRVQVRVVGIAPDALDRSNWDTPTQREWEKLEPLLLAPLDFYRIGNLPEEPTWCECQSPSGRILFTTFLDEGSPVGCLDCGQDVPLYRLPHLSPYGGHNEFRGWQADYKALDQLWMGSEMGERFAYRQLESASGVATYSFLLHYHKKWGKHCPLCQRKWRWKDSPREFLAFRCGHCRLVSSEWDSEAMPLSKLHR
jgi:predicted  nucleic acid-binding Zn ribbon protein